MCAVKITEGGRAQFEIGSVREREEGCELRLEIADRGLKKGAPATTH